MVPMVLADCPAASTLAPPNLAERRYFWSGPGGWQSTPSYSTHIASFQGSQWKGTNVGKIICVYLLDEANSFPLTLQNNKIVRKPTAEGWKQISLSHDGSEIILQCRNQDVSQCPFDPKEVTGLPEADLPNSNAEQIPLGNQENNEYNDFEGDPGRAARQTKEQTLDDFLSSMTSKKNQKKPASN